MTDSESKPFQQMTADEVYTSVMDAYDVRYPDATPFARGSFGYELRKFTAALDEIHLAIGCYP